MGQSKRVADQHTVCHGYMPRNFLRRPRAPAVWATRIMQSKHDRHSTPCFLIRTKYHIHKEPTRQAPLEHKHRTSCTCGLPPNRDVDHRVTSRPPKFYRIDAHASAPPHHLKNAVVTRRQAQLFARKTKFAAIAAYGYVYSTEAGGSVAVCMPRGCSILDSILDSISGCTGTKMPPPKTGKKGEGVIAHERPRSPRNGTKRLIRT